MNPAGSNSAPGPALTRVPLLADLEDALRRETSAVLELREALIDQRAGVASGQAAAVDASVDTVGRILLTLEEARRHRAALLRSLTGDAGAPVGRLEAAFGGPLPASLATAGNDLRHAAETVAHEVAINHHVLRGAIEAGEAFLQALFSASTDPAPHYGPGETRAGSGMIVNRRA